MAALNRAAMQLGRAFVAISLLVVIVAGGVLVGITGPTTWGSPAALSAPSTSGLGQAAVSNGIGASYAFGAAASQQGGLNIRAPAGTTTLTTTTMVATSATVTALTAPGSTTPVRQNQQGAGASLSPLSTSTNATRQVEFFSNVTLQASSAPAAYAKATAIAYSLGGYVADSSESNTTALVVMRVPASSEQDALSQVQAIGTLVSLRSSSNDVTVQYTDLNATLQSLQTEQASLLSILGQSTNINSTLNVESRIQAVDEQINSVESAILQTKTLVAYATISVLIEQTAPVQPLSIKVTATPHSGSSPLSVTFNSLTKGGVQPYIVNYNFGDGTSYEGQALIHTFARPGSYNVTVTATDASANVTEAWVLVNVSPPPAESTFGGFPSFIGGLFLHVVEGILEVAVVALPIAAAAALVLLPLQHRLRSSRRQESPGGAADEGGGSP